MPVDDRAPQSPDPEAASVNKIEPEHAAVEKVVAVPFPFKENKVLIYFTHNSNELPDQAFETLDQIADYMLHNLDGSIHIKGYTDSTGSYTYNISVSEFRANTIKTFLVGKGLETEESKHLDWGRKIPLTPIKPKQAGAKIAGSKSSLLLTSTPWASNRCNF